LTDPILEVKNLTISIKDKVICKDISFALSANKSLGIVGKSGAGKSVLVQSFLKLNKIKTQGEIFFQNDELTSKTKKELRKYCGTKIAYVFQDAHSSLNPSMTVGKQITEALVYHNYSYKEAKSKALLLMKEVGIDQVEQRYKQYPFQLSGGICQRICIAIALSLKPKLIIFDEPTTALDATIQHQVLELISKVSKKYKISTLFITHDLGLVAKMCDEVLVLEKGKVVEKGPVDKVILFPLHPHSKKLIGASINQFPDKLQMISQDQKDPFISIKRLHKTFYFHGKSITALNGINLDLYPNKTIALVGESGSGKTTLANLMVKLGRPTQGNIYLEKQPIQSYKEKEFREKVQIIFQNPFSSLNPLMNVYQILSEPFIVHSKPYNQEALESLLEEVKLSKSHLKVYPHQLSGGERQRVSIARSLALKPRFLILDEPTSALDVLIQREILLLLKQLQLKHGLSYLFITHNLSLIRYFADDIAVMYNGKIIEQGNCEAVFKNPAHTYTKRLLSSILSLNCVLEKKKNDKLEKELVSIS